MIPARLFLNRAGLSAALALLSADPGPLRVLRTSPSDGAPAAISVTFDRPVAGPLDRTVDPRRLITVTPAVTGATDWRDPVTLRLRPAGPLTPNTAYTVTISNQFQAMDGSRLGQPFSFTFRVRGPRVLAGWPAGPTTNPRYLTSDARFSLVFDVPPDRAGLERAAYLEFDKLCRSPGVVRLVLDSVRVISDSDRWDFREAGGWERDRSADRLGRVVVLTPERPLPPGCNGQLVMPASLDDEGRAQLQRWSFATHGEFRLARSNCGWDRTSCPTGPMVVRFSTPVRGAEVMRHVTLKPAVPFTVRDTAATSDQWSLDAVLKPRTWYAIVADSGLRDVFDQRLSGNPVVASTTTGYAPAINYSSGRAMVERVGLRTYGVSYVNLDTLEILLAPIPDSLEATFLARSEWSWPELWPALLPGATRRKLKVTSVRDQVRFYGIRLPVSSPATRRPTLLAIHVTSPQLDSASRMRRPIAVVQVTDLAIHVRVGLEDGVAWVTGASDGKARPGARVTLYNAAGKPIANATTDGQSLARFHDLGRNEQPGGPDEEEGGGYGGFEGYVAAVLGPDRALLGNSQYAPDLSPWRFNVYPAWGSDRLPVAAAVFTERGIYRPGEPLFAKAIVRTGLLGNLEVPASRDSLRWVFHDREGQNGTGVLQEAVVAPSAFGTADFAFRLPPTAALGSYDVAVQLRRDGRWTDVASEKKGRKGLFRELLSVRRSFSE
jgi:Bacterial alpha-2-macroglobulin MG3 domain/MG2 domain/Bacterial Ig-like domain